VPHGVAVKPSAQRKGRQLSVPRRSLCAMTQTQTSGDVQAFDLNIVKVLEHWTVAYALREIIANALDEATITGTAQPQIVQVDDGSWQVRDFGRGLRYQHLTQNESAEKRQHGAVIGQFGMGLKDALAVFDRRGVSVTIRTAHGDITTGRVAKSGFGDVITLHALVSPSADPSMSGTLVELHGLKDADVEDARAFFLHFSEDTLLEQTRYGSVLARGQNSKAGRIYVRGLLVAEEENFLFSYNITELTSALRRALNRERTNVGRTAYSPRVKDMLTLCESPQVAGPLTADLSRYARGTMHDELNWTDVAVHACRVLQTHEKVLFITSYQLEDASPQITYAKEDGYRLVVVSEEIARKLGTMTDLSGRPIVDLDAYRESWNDSFSFTFIDPAELTRAEQDVLALTGPVCALAGFTMRRVGVDTVAISETMRLDDTGHPVVGLYQAQDRRIVIQRGQLSEPGSFCGTLLHELGHARSGHTDGSIEFEDALTEMLGRVATAALPARH
jgi:hypothetical protein